MTVGMKLAQVVTEYDRKQANKRGYNPHALCLYLDAVHNVEEAIRTGADVRKAIVDNFCGRLLDVCLKAAGLPISTNGVEQIAPYAPEGSILEEL